MRNPPPLRVDPGDAEILRGWVEDGAAGPAAVRRARIVLLAAAGVGPSAIAAEVGCSKQTAITWRERFREGGVAGLRDAPRSGRPTTVDAAAVITRTLERPPDRLRAARWSTRLLAAELGISNVAVANVWRSWGIAPGAAGQVRLGTEPGLDVPVAAVVGLYLDAPVRVLALLVDGSGVGPEPEVAVERRPGVGARLAEVDTRAANGSTPGDDGGADALAAFFAGVDGAARPAGVDRLRLLVDSRIEPLRDWLDDRPDVAVHVVPPAASWLRLARVVCVLAGSSPEGARSVVELRRALDAHRPGEPFSWVRPAIAT